jgi:hypothetical protein
VRSGTWASPACREADRRPPLWAAGASRDRVTMGRSSAEASRRVIVQAEVLTPVSALCCKYQADADKQHDVEDEQVKMKHVDPRPHPGSAICSATLKPER